MSDEYTIRLKESDADSVLTVLRESVVFAYENTDFIALKDPHSGNSWDHDVRIFKENERELFLEITIGTDVLYRALKSALAAEDYELTEYEDDEVISLGKAFRQ